MKKQILKLQIPYNGEWKVIQDDSVKYKQYRVYWNRKQVDRCGCIKDCLHNIMQWSTGRKWIETDEVVPCINDR